MKKRDHLFQPGQSGNLGGRPRGSLNKTTLAVQALLDGEAEGLTRVAVEKALAGDMVALRLCMDRVLPARRERSIELNLPPLRASQDALKAIGTVLEAVGSGAITPSEGQAVASLLETHRRHYEIVELERRLEALEAEQCAAR